MRAEFKSVTRLITSKLTKLNEITINDAKAVTHHIGIQGLLLLSIKEVTKYISTIRPNQALRYSSI